MSAIVLFAAVALALAVSGFCSGSETGFMSVSRGRILHLVRSGGVRAGIVQRALSDMGRTTTALLVANNLANVVYSSASSALSILVFPDSPRLQAVWGAAAAIGILFLGEFLPKLFFSASPLRRILLTAPAWRIFERVFSPAAAVVQAVVNRLLPKREASVKVTPETVLKILQDRKDGVRISDFESAMIGRIMVLRSKGRAVTPEALLEVLDEDD
jgi:CBS domain containing-hemolysin-like protein